jgi:hypothetical protein
VLAGLREGHTGISLTCDTVAAAAATVTVTPTTASIAQVAYDRARTGAENAAAALKAADVALTNARNNQKAATEAQKNAAGALVKQVANCRSVPGCMVN